MANDKSIKWKKDDNNGICIFIVLVDIIIKMQSIISTLFSYYKYEMKKGKRKDLTLKIVDI